MTGGPRAVVVGLASVTGLQTARTLARHGIGVIGIAGNRRHFAARTRVCEQIIEADVHGPGFVAELERLGPRLHRRAVLYPCTDQSVLIISQCRDSLREWYEIVLPADDVVTTLAQKATFYRHAALHELPVPATFTLRSRADAEHAAATLPFPSVLKPSVKSAAWKRNAGVKVWPVSGPSELVTAYDRLAPWADALVAQQYIDGDDCQLYTCNCYFGADGQPLVTFVTRKRRQWPPHVGTASYATEWRDDDVLAATLRLFGTVRFRGLGYLELKRDIATGQLHIMEANIGRPTGRSATAEAGGVELLYTMYCDAVGLPLPASRTQRYVGATWIDLRRDLLSSAYYWRRGELSAAEWLHSMREPKVHAVLSARDPAPAAFEVVQSARKALRRALGRGAPPRDRGVTHAVADE